jgi:hypothetical protein
MRILRREARTGAAPNHRVTENGFARRRAHLTLIVFALVAATSSAVAQTTISLGAAEKVAVLGSSTVTNTGATTVIGNAALSSPGVSITGFPPGTIVGGAQYIGPGLANQAHADAVTAYGQLVADNANVTAVLFFCERSHSRTDEKFQRERGTAPFSCMTSSTTARNGSALKGLVR